MRALIAGLLEYSRVGRAQNSPSTDSVDTAELLSEVLADLDAAITESGATVVVAETLPTVVTDRMQLRRVFQNLLANAVKFHRPGCPAHVTVSAARVGTDWQITVTDDGIGIPAEHRERVFGMFQRLVRRKDYPGTGIGLTVTRKVVERLGGHIGVAETPGGGSTFRFTVPVHRSAAAAPAGESVTA